MPLIKGIKETSRLFKSIFVARHNHHYILHHPLFRLSINNAFGVFSDLRVIVCQKWCIVFLISLHFAHWDKRGKFKIWPQTSARISLPLRLGPVNSSAHRELRLVKWLWYVCVFDWLTSHSPAQKEIMWLVRLYTHESVNWIEPTLELYQWRSLHYHHIIFKHNLNPNSFHTSPPRLKIQVKSVCFHKQKRA